MIIVILAFGSTIAFAAMALLMPTKNMGLSMIGIVLGGLFIWPLYSTGIEYGCQIARPCSPEVVNGLIVSYGMVGGVIAMYTIGQGYSSAINAMIKGKSNSTAILMGWILTGVNGISILFALLIKGEDKIKHKTQKEELDELREEFVPQGESHQTEKKEDYAERTSSISSTATLLVSQRKESTSSAIALQDLGK